MKRVEFFVGSKWKKGTTCQATGLPIEENMTWEDWQVESLAATIFNNRYHIDGFSYNWIVGYWKSEKEDTLHVTVFTDYSLDIFQCIAQDLKEELNQESILLVYDNEPYFI